MSGVPVRFDPFAKFLPAAERLRRLEQERRDHEEMVAAKLRRLGGDGRRRLDEERHPSAEVMRHRAKVHAIRTAAPDLAAELPANATDLQLDQALLTILDRQTNGGAR